LRSLYAGRHPARLRELAGYLATLARHRVPIWQGRVVTAASAASDGRVGSVTLADLDNPGRPVATHEVDALCVGYGFRPQSELARMLGCPTRRDQVSGDLLPVIDEFGRASTPDGLAVWVAGEAGGIGGVHAALAEGELVAACLGGASGRSRHAAALRR